MITIKINHKYDSHPCVESNRYSKIEKDNGVIFRIALDCENVRLGSGTDINRSGFYFRFTPNNGHWCVDVRFGV